MTSATAIILVLYFIQGSLGHALSQPPIVGIAGGHAVNIEDAPFMTAVFRFDFYMNYTQLWCVGSIIHKQFVLTAAYCTLSHESYSDETWYLNNVALLKLSEPVTFGPSVAAIKLADASVNIPVGLAANVTGWGETGDSGMASLNLQQLSVTVSPPDGCNNYYKDYNTKLTDKQICVINGAKGSCFYDFGAPLIVGNLQIGFVSYGNVCVDVPNVYEKVAPHLQWIRNKIKQNL